MRRSLHRRTGARAGPASGIGLDVGASHTGALITALPLTDETSSQPMIWAVPIDETRD